MKTQCPYNVGDSLFRVYYNILTENWAVQPVVIIDFRPSARCWQFHVGDGVWVGSYSLFTNRTDAIRNRIFRNQQKHSLTEIDF